MYLIGGSKQDLRKESEQIAIIFLKSRRYQISFGPLSAGPYIRSRLYIRNDAYLSRTAEIEWLEYKGAGKKIPGGRKYMPSEQPQYYDVTRPAINSYSMNNTSAEFRKQL